MKISRVCFRDLYKNTRFLYTQAKKEHIFFQFKQFCRSVRNLNAPLRHCFLRRTLTIGSYARFRSSYKQLYVSQQSTAQLKLMESRTQVLRLCHLYSKSFIIHAWFGQCMFSSTPVYAAHLRKPTLHKYLTKLKKSVDDSITRTMFGWFITPTMARSSCFFKSRPRCYALYWYQGIKFGTFLNFRHRFRYKYVRDRRRKKKLVKDYRKKLRKFEHSIQENLRLLRGKRRKPKKKHVVYYK